MKAQNKIGLIFLSFAVIIAFMIIIAFLKTKPVKAVSGYEQSEAEPEEIASPSESFDPELENERFDIDNLDRILTACEIYCADKDQLEGITIRGELGQPVVVTGSNSNAAVTADKIGDALVDNGILKNAGDPLPLIGDQWAVNLAFTYTPATGKKIYEGESPNYIASENNSYIKTR